MKVCSNSFLFLIVWGFGELKAFGVWVEELGDRNSFGLLEGS